MKKLLALGAVLAFLGACSGSSGGCGGDAHKNDAGQSAPMAGGGPSHGSLGEPVSFQGLGRKAPPPPPAAAQAAASSSPSSAPGATASGAGAEESVLCGGFPDLPADCKKSPLFKAIQAKCCPKGQVDRCQAMPGGARLFGHSCR